MNRTCGKKRTEVSKKPKGKLARFTDDPTQ